MCYCEHVVWNKELKVYIQDVIILQLVCIYKKTDTLIYRPVSLTLHIIPVWQRESPGLQGFVSVMPYNTVGWYHCVRQLHPSVLTTFHPEIDRSVIVQYYPFVSPGNPAKRKEKHSTFGNYWNHFRQQYNNLLEVCGLHLGFGYDWDAPSLGSIHTDRLHVHLRLSFISTVPILMMHRKCRRLVWIGSWSLHPVWSSSNQCTILRSLNYSNWVHSAQLNPVCSN